MFYVRWSVPGPKKVSQKSWKSLLEQGGSGAAASQAQSTQASPKQRKPEPPKPKPAERKPKTIYKDLLKPATTPKKSQPGNGGKKGAAEGASAEEDARRQAVTSFNGVLGKQQHSSLTMPDDIPPAVDAEGRVAMWCCTTQRRVVGREAPLQAEAGCWLREHPECEVYNGQDLPPQWQQWRQWQQWQQQQQAMGMGMSPPVGSPNEMHHQMYQGWYPQGGMAGWYGGAQWPANGDGNQRVPVWDRRTNDIVSGKKAPRQKQLMEYLRQHPYMEVYRGPLPHDPQLEDDDDEDEDEESSVAASPDFSSSIQMPSRAPTCAPPRPLKRRRAGPGAVEDLTKDDCSLQKRKKEDEAIDSLLQSFFSDQHARSASQAHPSVAGGSAGSPHHSESGSDTIIDCSTPDTDFQWTDSDLQELEEVDLAIDFFDANSVPAVGGGDLSEAWGEDDIAELLADTA